MQSWLRAMALPGLVGVALLSGCASNVPPAAPNPYVMPTYTIAPSDRLRITVFGEEALTKEYVVTSAGDISFPLLGDIPASGKSVSELSQMLTTELSNGYLNDPRINVEVLNYRPFYVLGEVGNSGEFTFKPELTAMQAIAVAGGFTYRADRSRVFIRRSGDDREYTYNLDTGRVVYIQPGDTIRVGERYF